MKLGAGAIKGNGPMAVKEDRGFPLRAFIDIECQGAGQAQEAAAAVVAVPAGIYSQQQTFLIDAQELVDAVDAIVDAAPAAPGGTLY